MTLFVTLFDIAFLLSLLAFLFLIWREGVKRRNTTDTTLIDVTTRSNQAAHRAADAAHEAAESAHDAAESAMRLASYLEKRFNAEPPAQ